MAEEISVTAVCDGCGKALGTSGLSYNRGDIAISLEPCPHCFQEKYDEGHADGREEGYQAGKEEASE